MKIKKYQKGGVSRKKYIMKDGKKIEVSMNDITLGNKSSEEKSNFIKKYGPGPYTIVTERGGDKKTKSKTHKLDWMSGVSDAPSYLGGPSEKKRKDREDKKSVLGYSEKVSTKKEKIVKRGAPKREGRPVFKKVVERKKDDKGKMKRTKTFNIMKIKKYQNGGATDIPPAKKEELKKTLRSFQKDLAMAKTPKEKMDAKKDIMSAMEEMQSMGMTMKEIKSIAEAGKKFRRMKPMMAPKASAPMKRRMEDKMAPKFNKGGRVDSMGRKITRTVVKDGKKIYYGKDPSGNEVKLGSSTRPKAAKGMMMKKYLKGGQVKLDANKDGKISAEDFKMLRQKNKAAYGMMMKKMKAAGGMMMKKYQEGGLSEADKKKMRRRRALRTLGAVGSGVIGGMVGGPAGAFAGPAAYAQFLRTKDQPGRAEIKSEKKADRKTRAEQRKEDRKFSRGEFKKLSGRQKMAGDVGRETDTGFRAGRYGQRALLGVGRMKRLKEVLERNKKLRKKLGKKGVAKI
tara:strand:- start:1650 stop:3179 length:1530 start_codon:yes stop_codon:yes gene_type:complete